MLDWVTISLLITFGISLVIVEILFVPGTTFVGLIGGLLYGAGIFITFKDYGTTTGIIVFLSSGIVGAIAIVYSLKSGVWKHFALNEQMSSRFNEEFAVRVKVGDEGIAVSALRPFGKAEFKDELYEVKTEGFFVKAGEKVRVIRVEAQRIFVEPINQSI